MSATGRGTVRDEKDFYATPHAAFAPLLEILPSGTDRLFTDPCAGDGRLLAWLRLSGRLAIGTDLFPQKGSTIERTYYDETPRDFLADKTQHDFILTNPPFSAAFEMCKHALAHSREFMFLLRLSFLESEERGDWFEQHEPNGLWVLKKRPSFVMSVTCKSGISVHAHIPCKHNWLLPIESERPKVCPKCGGTNLGISTSDSSGYAWYYWGPRAELCGIHHI